MYRTLFIANVFKVINLLLLVVVIAYVFKRYILSVIKGEMADEKLKVRNLESSIINSEAQAHQIDSDIKNIDSNTKVLLKKIKIWSNAVEKGEEAQNNELNANLDKAKARAKEQEKSLEESTILKLVVPLAIDKMEQSALSEFSDKKNKNKFLKYALSNLEGKA